MLPTARLCRGFQAGLRQSAAFCFAMSIGFVLPLVTTTANAEDGCSLTLGALFPETGPASLIGERSRQSAELALEQLPPEIRKRVSIRFEDTQMKPAVGLSAAKRLLEDPNVSLLTGFGSELVGAVAPVLEAKKVVGVFATPDRRPIKGKNYLFCHWVDENDLFRVISGELLARGQKKIAIVYSEIPAMSLFHENFVKGSAEKGLEIVFERNLLPTDTDFRAVVSALVNKRPDAVVFFMLPPQPSVFAKELRLAAPGLPMFSYINLENSHEVKAAGGALEGTLYAGPKFEEWFTAAFQKRFGQTPEFASGDIYDIVTLAGKAVAAGACSSEELRAFFLKQTSVDGALGRYGVQDTNDFRFPSHLKVIRGGKFELVTGSSASVR